MTDLRSRPLIEKLIAFNTTSHLSNLELMAFVQDYLNGHGVESRLVHDDTGTKANLYATLGPTDRGGIMLSGHTDVVPVDGQDWATDPFTVTEKDGKLYGRGTSDMKSFIAIALAFVPEFLKRGLSTPIHLAFSHDEEVGCIGVRSLIKMMNEQPIRPIMGIIGEPTSMQVCVGHKGKRSYRAVFKGKEAHSSLTPMGVNAIDYAARLAVFLRGMADRIAGDGPFDELYDVAYTTVHTGVMKGGEQLNIVPGRCEMDFEFRHLPKHDPEALDAEIMAYVRKLEAAMQAASPETGITVSALSGIPALDTDPTDEVVTLAKQLAGRNDHAAVAFGTEAGLFQQSAGVPSVIVGPGSINQAHKPDEYISLDQVAKGEEFMARLADKVCAS
ncbi:MAG: acetylornithine deacetylase [Rhodospirillales bacterium]